MLNSMKTGTKRSRKESEAEQASRKKKKVDCFASLHDDLLIDILQKLPADILRYKTRFVCKRWFSLITNRILFDHASLILETSYGSRTVRLLDISEDKHGLTLKEQNLEIPYTGRIKSWCNEFLLITDLYKEGSLFIYDMIRKQGSFLPPCSTSCGGHYGCKCGVGLSYDKFKGVYKVVHAFLGPQIQCELLIFKGDIASCNSYRNLFDIMLDAVIVAMAVAGHENIPVVVAETGWPCYDSNNEVEAREVYAKMYLQGLVNHVRSGKGTPLKREGATEVYVYELFDRNDTGSESLGWQNWGFCYLNMSLKFDIDFSNGGGSMLMEEGVKMVTMCLMILVLYTF
uniref:Putative glycoside hydrolase family 17, F-box domain-containing protein n=1 Tax=Helianthus annuus TaxID=4232 RepID=A0A251UD39_HELAN